MSIKFETKGDPSRVVMSIDGEDLTVARAIAEDFRAKTGIGVDIDALTKYIILRRADKMTVLEGNMNGGETPEKQIVKITFNAREIQAIDDYRASLSEVVGVEIERSKAIKALLNKGQIALGLEPVFK